MRRDRSSLREMRGSSRPCFPDGPGRHGAALLHQWLRARPRYRNEQAARPSSSQPVSTRSMNEQLPRARAPRAARRPSTSNHHGIERVDDYAWLRADNWQAVMRDPALLAPDISAHLEAENAYTKAMMADTEALQATLFAEMKGRIKEDDVERPRSRRALRLLHALRGRRTASAVLPEAERRRRASKSCSTAMRWPSRTPISASPVSPTAPTTASSPMPSIPRARSSTPSMSSRRRPALVDSRIADNNGSLAMGRRQPDPPLCLAR